MENPTILFAVFAVVIIVIAILAAMIGYFWASSATKADLLKQLKDQGDSANKQAQEQLQRWKEQELISIRQQMLEGVRGEAIQEAQTQLVKWRTEELEKAKSQIWEVLSKEANLSLDQWKVEAEKEIRKDAIDKSQSVTMGKMTEHMVPYLPGFGFNPSDARFIGSPIDLIVFDGLGNDEVKKIVFVEIKTGTSTLSTRERLVRGAIIEKRVEWIEMKVNLEGPDIVHKGKSKRKIANEEAGWMLNLLKNNDE
jgi:predicted Holliday junction resolvase-like endonuclease